MLALMASPAVAQQPAPPASSTMLNKTNAQMAPMPGMVLAPTTVSSTKAFKAVDDNMMKAMDRPMTGSTDQNFVAGMLPHHTGAVDMARVELKYGKDPEMLRLASRIIATQRKEIAQMRAWQARHPEQQHE